MRASLATTVDNAQRSLSESINNNSTLSEINPNRYRRDSSQKAATWSDFLIAHSTNDGKQYSLPIASPDHL